MEDLPLPVNPTNATVVPGSATKLRLDSTPLPGLVAE